MPKPIRLFIQPTQSPAWKEIRGWGTTPFSDYICLQTRGEGKVYAAATGHLSVNAPDMSGYAPFEPIRLQSVSASSPPKSINLYLKIPFTTVSRAPYRNFISHNSPNGETVRFNIIGFAYLNVQTSSFAKALKRQLQDACLYTGFPLATETLVDLFLKGQISPMVQAGELIGEANQDSSVASSPRTLGFAVLTQSGPIDPAMTYDKLRDFVKEGSAGVDKLLQIMPVSDVLNVSPAEFMERTEKQIYPMSVLRTLKSAHNLSSSDWRRLGDNQKELYRQRLLKRAGYPLATSTQPSFAFNHLDWKNTFQLEAVVEFYLNYTDPWLPTRESPRQPDPADRIDFLPPSGNAATITSTGRGYLARLDGSPNLRWVNAHGIRSENSITFKSGSNSFTTRILGVSESSPNEVFIASPPYSLQENENTRFSWKINLLPIVIIIDPIGGRICGASASCRSGGNVVTLHNSDPKELEKINVYFDTIYFPEDSSSNNRSRSYRIIDKHSAQNQLNRNQIRVHGNPVLPQQDYMNKSPWYIPAGIAESKILPDLSYLLDRSRPIVGYDHFDAVAFIINNGTVQNRFRWNTFSNKQRTSQPQLNTRASIRGNKCYQISSYRSGDRYLNYSFKVNEVGRGNQRRDDYCLDSRLYFRRSLNAPSAGRRQTLIRLHHTPEVYTKANTAGCLVSPQYYHFRIALIKVYQSEYKALNDQRDISITSLETAYTFLATMSIYLPGTPLGTQEPGTNVPRSYKVSARNWNHKICGWLFLIRPDEKP